MPTNAELLLRASLDCLSLSAAYRERPLGYWDSPEIFLVPPTAEDDGAAGEGSFEGVVALDLARYLSTKLLDSSLDLLL